MDKVFGLLVAGLIGMAVGITLSWVNLDRGPDEVTTFNAGFSDSKLDDCQQGFAPACDWLSAK